MGHLSSKPISSRCSGFTFLEVVIAMVIVGILGSALARFVDFDAANKAAADLGYQAVEARWKTIQVEKISDTVSSKSAAFPSLADLSGYVEASAPEPAPDTAPVKIDYSFLLEASSSLTVVRNSTSLGFEKVDQVFCDNAFILSKITTLPWYTTNSGNRLISASYERASGGTEVSVDPSSPVPKCRGSVLFFNGYSSTGYTPTVWASAQASMEANPSGYYAWTDFSYVKTLYAPFLDETLSAASGYGWVRDLPAKHWRFSCDGPSVAYGVDYLISGGVGTYASANGKQKDTTWRTVAWSPTTTIQSSPRIDAAEGVVPTVPSGLVCTRQGPAPVLPPATDGNPGNPAPKADFSGLCVAKGWSVATFKADGAPTSAATDLVARISSPTEDSSCE